MVHLHMLVEGRTEQAFARNVLAPQLAVQNVHIASIETTGPRTGRTASTGGSLNFDRERRTILNLLAQHARPNAFLTTMFDLYKLPSNFPGFADAKKIANPYIRVSTVENALALDIGNRRFIPYIQLHEFEALLFADPMVFSRQFANRPNASRELEEIRDRHGKGNPELINDGEQTAPSKRITAAVPEYKKQKRVAALQLAQTIGLEKIRSACQHFHQWLTRLEQLQPLDSPPPV